MSHVLIFKILEKLNFGPTIKSFIKTIYKNMSSRLLLNGLITEPFRVTRSVRQGDGLSMVLYILISELLATMIRKDMDITPICLPNSKPKKLGTYADDISVMTENIRGLNCLEKIIGKYERATGAKINKEKTEILLVGRWTKKQRNLVPERFRSYIRDAVRVLGVMFGHDAANLNENALLEKVNTEIDRWTCRNLTLQGKIEIIKVVILSKIWHTAKVTGLRRKFIDSINSKLIKFFWFPKKYSPVSTRVLQNGIAAGGLDFPDITLELEAYQLELVGQAIKTPEKPWVGMLKYRAGKEMASTTNTNPARGEIHACYKNKIAKLLDNLVQKTEGKTMNWSKVTVKKLKTQIQQNVPVPKTDIEVTPDMWRNIHNSSGIRKRTELNYLMAHGRLPLAEFLSKIGKIEDGKCHLCGREKETQRHLFYNCTAIRDIRSLLEKFAGRQGVKNLTYETVIRHTPKMNRSTNEAISIFKECVWHSRCAAINEGPKNVMKQIRGQYEFKMKRAGIG